MLASTEVVAGKTVSCFSAIKDVLVHAGATCKDAEVVEDGNLITSRQPSDLPAFLEAIICALGGKVQCPTCQTVLYGAQPEA
jgi:protease I